MILNLYKNGWGDYMEFSIPYTNWMWVPCWNAEDDAEPRIVYFRKEIEVVAVPSKFVIKISADSRYKLYVNGVFLQAGPEKGNQEIWYCDQADIASCLTEGKNVIAVEVLRYPEDSHKSNHSLIRTKTPGLYVDNITDASSREILNGRNGLKCRRAKHITLMQEPSKPAPLHILEDAAGDLELKGWKLTGYDDSAWLEAQIYNIFDAPAAQSPRNLMERDIPYQIVKKRKFAKVICVRKLVEKNKKETVVNSIFYEWNGLLAGKNSVTVPAFTKLVVEIDAGELMTGFLEVEAVKGTNCKMKIQCAECYAYPPKDSDAIVSVPIKGDRTDWENGSLYGHCDYYQVTGYGTKEMPEYYEPYWFRTFRYIQITVETAGEELIISNLSYRETGYPLEVKTKVITSDTSMKDIWNISERTLRRCMHETYMDCPFYEQLQYVMDCRSEILFTYTTSADDRLARRAMEDFRLSQRSDGLINACAPTIETNVIPGFSIYYILMLHDHMMYFGDKKLIRKHLPAVDSILNFFQDNLDETGLVGQIGGALFKNKYWSFIDWTPEWDETKGMPLAGLKGSVTMESLLYILGLQKATELAEFTRRSGIAEEYRRRAESIKKAISVYCMGKRTGLKGEVIPLIQDGPGVEEYSVHCQVFAILADIVSPDEGKKMLQATVGKTGYAQCSVAMTFYLFRALEITDWYEKANDVWNLWREMIKNNLTTCVENNTDKRSDCHAWGAVILYELPAVSLGVKPVSPGFSVVSLKPKMGYLDFCKGDVITPRGLVHVEWERDKYGKCKLNYTVPENMEVIE